MFVLDTNVVSELRKAKDGRADRHVVAWAVSVAPPSLFLSAITIPELELGVLLIERRDPAQGAVLRSWLSDRVQTDRDALIAATALVHGMTVVTRNTADFAATGVPVINPWEV